MMKTERVNSILEYPNGDKLVGTLSFHLSHNCQNGKKWKIMGIIYSNGVPMAFSEEEINKHAHRQRLRTEITAMQQRNTGLAHIDFGHLNKHLLKMKYKNTRKI